MDKPLDKPRRLARRVIYENPWVNLYVDRVEFPGGRVIEAHHILEFEKEAAAVLVENAAGDLLLVEAYRYTTDSVGWELPAGSSEPGEDVLALAQREVLEETGYQTSGHRLIYTFHPLNGISNKVFHLVHCRATTHIDEFDRNEVRSVRWFSKAEIAAMVRTRQLRDGYSLVGLFLYWLGVE